MLKHCSWLVHPSQHLCSLGTQQQRVLPGNHQSCPLLLIHFLVAHLRVSVSPLPGDICLLRKSDLSTLSVGGR